ncbi:MAG: Cell surface glycan-binding lipoprotein, utilization system for glycans and polysaccharides (PUL), SusD family [uncultured Cytophagales bacterium]|uniref:Cell surface glycan-binding lipoprotein, utilization system for glycans and polysaccharides (PUL), SusD family n=1 Tax=uncultured Cytophagales bacterium TaxID=158755 RepID=A0A6J4H0B5_9SPHI|nr:MAG: Cell surface glycan-binding lipoprotein, utilization system for glycans and polysaccharides (PUL), SusD family [uncultured Cytophagales bacterium]
MKKRILALLTVSAMAIGGCNDDILDTKNQSAYDEATYFTSAPTFNEGVIAIYSGLLMPGLYSRDAYFTFDLLGNDASKNIFLPSEIAVLEDYSYGSAQPQIQDLWKNLYRMVLRANVLLDKSKQWNPTLESEQRSKMQYLAEAQFLRGYANFMLVSLWGRVPLKRDYETAAVDAPRASVEEVWAAVEQDFTDAIAGLPVAHNASNLGRVTQGAAVAMLGKSYLYQKKYAQAEEQFKKLLTAPYAYSLSKSLDALFTPSGLAKNFENADVPTSNNGREPEVIFNVPHGKWEGWGTGNAFYMFGGQEAWGGKATHSGRAQEYGWNDWNNVVVSNALVQAFKYKNEAGQDYIDPRAALTFYGDAPSGGDVTYCDKCSGGPKPFPFTPTGTVRYNWRKYGIYEVAEKSNIPQSDINTIIIRLADVKLMLAEALIYQNKPAEALTQINEVRTRSGAFAYTSLGDQQSALAILRRERQLELAGEQVRWFDLNRWGIAKQVLNAEKQAQLGRQPFQDKHALLPIPQLEKESNPRVAAEVTGDWN